MKKERQRTLKTALASPIMSMHEHERLTLVCVQRGPSLDGDAETNLLL